MREQEMRQRIEQFLQSRLRAMVLPATLGLGLALGACNSDGLSNDDGGDQPAKTDSGTVGMKYMAQLPDAGPDSDRMVALYMAQLPLPRS